MQILKAGVLYFALVFGVGFELGPIRIMWAVPRFGERTAELMETPIMLGGNHSRGAVDSSATPGAVHSVQSTWDGLRGPWPLVGRGVHACALAMVIEDVQPNRHVRLPLTSIQRRDIEREARQR